MDKGHVYILELEGNNWYVGWSQDVQTRIASHFLGAGSKWTMLHKPLAIHSVRQGDTLLETCTTIALMATHGYERVRGGSYCNIDMGKPPVALAKALHWATYKTNCKESNSTSSDSQTTG